MIIVVKPCFSRSTLWIASLHDYMLMFFPPPFLPFWSVCHVEAIGRSLSPPFRVINLLTPGSMTLWYPRRSSVWYTTKIFCLLWSNTKDWSTILFENGLFIWMLKMLLALCSTTSHFPEVMATNFISFEIFFSVLNNFVDGIFFIIKSWYHMCKYTKNIIFCISMLLSLIRFLINKVEQS